MSFGVWLAEPQMQVDPPEVVVKVGDYWVVTDKPETATPQKVAEVLAAASAQA